MLYNSNEMIKIAIDIGIQNKCLPRKFTLSKRGNGDLVKILDQLIDAGLDIRTISGVAMGYCAGFYFGVTEAGDIVENEENGE